jgi:Sec-independent protein secretion pathway component TatC
MREAISHGDQGKRKYLTAALVIIAALVTELVDVKTTNTVAFPHTYLLHCGPVVWWV